MFADPGGIDPTHGQISLQLRDRERSAAEAWPDPHRREGDRAAEAEANVHREPAVSRPGETFWQAAVRSLALDVRHDADAPAAIPKTGPVVVVANHPYGVLDGIVISWLVSKVRADFLVLTNAVLMRAPEVRNFILPIDFSETEEARKTNLGSRAAARAQLGKGGVLVVFPAGAISTAPDKLGLQARGRRALAAVRLAAHPALEGGGRANLVRRPEQPAVPDREPRQLFAPDLADLPRGEIEDRDVAPGRDRCADPVRTRLRRSRIGRRWRTSCAGGSTLWPGARRRTGGRSAPCSSGRSSERRKDLSGRPDFPQASRRLTLARDRGRRPGRGPRRRPEACRSARTRRSACPPRGNQ